MSTLDGIDWLVRQSPLMTEDDVFDAWLAIGGDWTLDEIRDACQSLGRLA